MKDIHRLDRDELTMEELLPGYTREFPYIASRVEIDHHPGRIVPWHWRRAVELFYIDRGGALEYRTPTKTLVFPAGSAGFVNSNVLHMTVPHAGERDDRQLLHIFDPSLIGGTQGSLIEKKYVLPLTSAHQVEIIPLYPDREDHRELLGLIRDSFSISDREPDYELKLRSALSEIWLRLLDLTAPELKRSGTAGTASDQLKQMMVYVHEHYAEKITVADLSARACLSQRACYRLFRDHLRITPLEYIHSYRLQIACRMLASTTDSVTHIAGACGFGSSSYFGKLFLRAFGCTPLSYRRSCRSEPSGGTP